MAYVDGFVLPVPTKNLAAYRRMSAKAGKIWREHGALDYKECAGDDLQIEGMSATFEKAFGIKRTETVVFAYIVYKSRADRDRVNKKVMADPRMAENSKKPMPFDMKRMVMGGFKVIVDV